MAGSYPDQKTQGDFNRLPVKRGKSVWPIPALGEQAYPSDNDGNNGH
jgi:hypothetical protein